MSATTKKQSTSQWHAFVQNPNGIAGVWAFQTQKELKKLLNSLPQGVVVISIVKGKSFGVKVQKSYELTPASSLEPVPCEEAQAS